MQQKKKSPRGFPQEFRDKAVRLVIESGHNIDDVAKQLGCSTESLRRWKDASQKTLDPETARRVELGEDENKRLRKENAQLRTENEILKKATAYFAREVM